MIVPFRPSSHSEDCTIIATFQDKNVASKVAEEDPSYITFSNKIALQISGVTSYIVWGELEFLKEKNAEKVEVYNRYQELTIEIRIPKGATKETLPLILPKQDYKIFLFLRKICKEITTKTIGSETQWTFKYEGERIYFTAKPPDKGLFIIKNEQLTPSRSIKVTVNREI